ncbi:hypothetical protein PAPYR_505 [Paratrimastix pyriformis]|uniref:Uncharacterized protein n=1 Tax=Paratrimastix pyriformis TaxID=342808 RepID=A0ABQ8UUK4_9EUKA|nr:hypothetical protein PAPYR_505 [Paratrimastix pyriformis]
MTFRGTPRVLSFDDKLEDSTLIPTADALAALIGPCKDLIKLSFRPPGDSPDRPSAYGCGFDEASCAGWVDEAFGGHNRLAVLEYLPTFYEPVIEHILRHLPGLCELNTGEVPITAALTTTIVRSCPRLQDLRTDAIGYEDDDVVPLLAPLVDLRRFHTLSRIFVPDGMNKLSHSVTAVGVVFLGTFPGDAFKPLAAHLTRLSLDVDDCESDNPEANIPGRFCLLAANRATLQRIKLDFKDLDAAGLAAMVGALNDLPRLTHLQIDWGALPPGSDSNVALLPGLHSQLERMALSFECDPEEKTPRPPLHIISDRLRRLDLGDIDPAVSGLTVDCPALVELRLPAVDTGGQVTLKCPRLRTLRDGPFWLNCFAPPMPDLETVSARVWDPIWLLDLWAVSPRLRSLEVHLAAVGRKMLPMLAAGAASLVELALELDLAQMPNPLVLRLPGRLESLRLSLRNVGAPLDLQVEAPRLRRSVIRSVFQEIKLKCRLLCPELTALEIEARGGHSQITMLEVDDRAQLRSLKMTPSLPRLAHLMLQISNAPSPLSLACPQLRILRLGWVGTEQKVLLACPLLEYCSNPVELAVSAPNLPPLRR